jgi:uncharacterized protein
MFTDKQRQIITDTENFAQNFMKNYDESHDFAHVIRVKNLATLIAQSENMTSNDIFEIQLGALMHDINDHKYTCDIFAQEIIIEQFFKNKIDEHIIKNITKIACNVSLSKETTLEHNGVFIKCAKLHCVQDADRIDSLGSIGITRYFMYGISQKNSNIKDIIKNIDIRSSILIKHIKTEMGMKIASQKYEIIKMFIDDYNTTIL